MRLRISFLVALCIAFLVTLSLIAAKPPKGVSDKAQKARGTATDENIKHGVSKNSEKDNPPIPPSKGGPKSRDYCDIHVDNRTPWHVDVYMDGDYAGTVGTYGDVYGTIHNRAVMYAVADFDDGSRLTWGPRALSCSSSTTWTLTR